MGAPGDKNRKQERKSKTLGISPSRSFLAGCDVGKTCSRVCPAYFLGGSFFHADVAFHYISFAVVVGPIFSILDRYSLLQAKEVEGMRFVQLRNPWGHDEWGGPWSDRSDEWKANPKIQKGLQESKN